VVLYSQFPSYSMQPLLTNYGIVIISDTSDYVAVTDKMRQSGFW